MIFSLLKRYFYNYKTGQLSLIIGPYSILNWKDLLNSRTYKRIFKYLKYKIYLILYAKEDIVTLKDIRIYKDLKEYKVEWDKDYRWNELKANLKYKIINNCILITGVYIAKITYNSSNYIRQNFKYKVIDGGHRFAILREIYGEDYKVKIKYYE